MESSKDTHKTTIVNDIVEKLQHTIHLKNQDIVHDQGGSQDAMHDPEWAAFEGIKLIEYDIEAIKLIAKSSDGLNDAITLLDKCIGRSLSLTVDAVTESLNMED